MPNWIEIDEPHDLTSWQRSLRDPPPALGAAVAKGVREAADPFTPFGRLCEAGGDGVEDGVWRHPDGSLTVACTTPMPGVTADMWDWWFGWHSLSSARYRLWHPDAHRKSQIAHDMRHLPTGRPRYVGNVSAVDEYIGTQMTRLAIAFVAPSAFGMDQVKVDALGTAICANVSLRTERMQTGQLVHLIENSGDGCVMHSRFHLGHLRSAVPIVGPFLTFLLSRRSARIKLVNDQTGLALLRHCFEEMHHLAAILPDLHRTFGQD